nr:extracellular solute-binding protein [bacterium]
MKKRWMAVIVAVVMLMGLCACGQTGGGKAADSNRITMYLWDKSMTKELTPWLEKQFPQLEFEFIIGYNSMDFYSYLLERGQLPDIITCRRFSLNDAAKLKDELLDMSTTELVGTFYFSYIENNRDTDGAIKWLPMCAEVDGIVANRDVFDAYHVPIPTNYAEFVQACRIFEENGIDSFYNDYCQDYSCLEAMQGCAIPELMSLEGTRWRAEYESETVDGSVGLDDRVWPVVFDKFQQFLQDTHVQPGDIDVSFNQAKEMFLNNRLAMFRGTGNDCVVINQEYGINTMMLPYYGATEADNWLLTYPIFQVAVNKRVARDAVKKQHIMNVLEAVFSAEGQAHTAVGSSVLTYNKTVDIELADSMEMVKACVERNHLYQRLASTEMFAISKDVGQKMIAGQYDAKAAYQAFNAQLTTPKNLDKAAYVACLENGYDYTFTNHGSQAVSAVVNTIRKQIGADILIGYSSLITSPVFAGNYTAQQMNWLINNRAALTTAELTGAQIKQVMEWLVDIKENGANPIRHLDQIPAASGMEYAMRADGDGTYTLESVTINAKPLEDNATYTVAFLGDDNALEAEVYCGCPMPQDIKALRQNITGKTVEHLAAALDGGGQMEPPTQYVTITGNMR